MVKWHKVLAIIIAVIEALFPFIQTDEEKEADEVVLAR